MTTTTQVTPAQVAEFLNLLSRTAAVPVFVRIGRTAYVGARYDQVRDHQEGTRAYAEGARTYVQSAVYLLGELPPAYVRDRRTVFVTEEGERFYVASYIEQERVTEENDMFHPFGAHFQLMPDEMKVTPEEAPTMTMKFLEVAGA